MKQKLHDCITQRFKLCEYVQSRSDTSIIQQTTCKSYTCNYVDKLYYVEPTLVAWRSLLVLVEAVLGYHHQEEMTERPHGEGGGEVEQRFQ